MGLDSVELIMSVEDKFGIRIEDYEAEKINTVQDFADCVYNKIIVNPTDICLAQKIFYQFKKAFQNLKFTELEILPASKISDLLNQSEIKANWTKLEIEIGLKLPELVAIDFNHSSGTHVKFFGIKTIKRNTPVTKGTLRNLVDWCISLNYHKLVDVKKITSKYEVERIIAGIISENMGIPISEIELKHIISQDLGVD